MRKDDSSATELLDSPKVMTDEKNSATARSNIVHFSKALLLKIGVAHGEHFVNQKNFRLKVSRDSESKSQLHAA